MSVILMHSATAFHLVKLAGACYLVWLDGVCGALLVGFGVRLALERR